MWNSRQNTITCQSEPNNSVTAKALHLHFRAVHRSTSKFAVESYKIENTFLQLEGLNIRTPDCAKMFLVIGLQLMWLASSSHASFRCRCTYGQSCWPSTSDFSTLASEVSQPLIQPLPPASACYPVSSPSGNCTDFQENRFDGNWRSDQSGSMQSPNFESFIFKNGSISACYANTTLGVPCTQGSVPVIGVDTRSVADIQAAVKFATEHNLRLVVKNTG